MIKYLFFSVFLLANIGIKAQDLENSLLWKISGNGIEKPSYLYGTIHAICDATLDDSVIDAMKKTGQLYLEIDLNDPQLQNIMIEGMKMRDGITMSSLLSNDDFIIIDDFLIKNTGFSAKILDNIKPSLVSAMLINKVLGCEPKSIEDALMQLSISENEEIYGLESIKEQIAVFDKIAYEDQIEELLKTAKNGIQEYTIEYNKMMTLYFEKNITKLIEITNKSDSVIAENQDVFLDRRNKNWIPIIAEVSIYKPTFFGVGAAHLAGENGVIKLLRKSGFTVEAVH